MGICTKRHFFLTLCVLHILTVVEIEVFDFFGFLWIPILVNFFEIIFIIFGFFGAYQYRPKYIIVYLLWQLLWIAWNAFLICLFLNVAGLDHETNKVLKLDHTSDSWWKKNGPGCKMVNVDEIPQYEGCLLDYTYIEIVHSGLQVLLTVFSALVGICLSRTFLEEDDTFHFQRADRIDINILHPTMYVNRRSENLHGSFSLLSNNKLNNNEFELIDDFDNSNFSRRAAKNINNNNKRVYVDAIRYPVRRSNSFNVRANNNSSKRTEGLIRPKSSCLNDAHHIFDEYSSHKSSSRKNAKQRMSLYSIEFSSQLENRPDGDSDNELDHNIQSSPKPMTPRRVKRRSVMQRGTSGRHSTTSRRHHAQNRSSTRNSRRSQNPVTKLLDQQQQQQQQQKCQHVYENNVITSSSSPLESPLPNYYANNSARSLNNNTSQHWQGPSSSSLSVGHTNPSYQQSITSLNEEFEDIYNNRPASVRSSYSNFHGARANYSPPKLLLSNHSHATPQVPQKRGGNPARNSMKNMTFLNNGPPAYTVQGAIALDSETPM